MKPIGIKPDFCAEYNINEKDEKDPKFKVISDLCY